MEEIILSKLISSIIGNETPSNIVLCGIVAYILWMLKGFRKDVKEIKNDLKETSKDICLIKHHLGITNVIELPNNKESKK